MKKPDYEKIKKIGKEILTKVYHEDFSLIEHYILISGLYNSFLISNKKFFSPELFEKLRELEIKTSYNIIAKNEKSQD